MRQFKIGDKVRFKSPDSGNARYFEHGLTNLTIRYNREDLSYCNVEESDGSNIWLVYGAELEFDTPKFKSWRDKYENQSR